MSEPVANRVASAEEAEAQIPDADEFVLSKEFYDAYKAHHELLRRQDAPKAAPGELDGLAAKLRSIAFHVARLRLFSPNEELDDISTADLKYLLVPFLLAEVTAATQDFERRLDALRQALVYWRAFAHDCERLSVAHADDVRSIDRNPEEALDPMSKRTEKIERYKRAKELDEQVAYLFAKRREASGDPFRWGASGDFDEELERELVMKLLKRAVARTADDISSAQAELPMLEMMIARGGPGADPVEEPPRNNDKPWVVRLQDKAEVTRLYKEMVFQCPFAQPTMTLAEHADSEIQEARERQARLAERESRERAEEAERWYAGDRYGSKEEEDEDREIYKARDWDDWKDDHPYGSGNKMANIG